MRHLFISHFVIRLVIVICTYLVWDTYQANTGLCLKIWQVGYDLGVVSFLAFTTFYAHLFIYLFVCDKQGLVLCICLIQLFDTKWYKYGMSSTIFLKIWFIHLCRCARGWLLQIWVLCVLNLRAAWWKCHLSLWFFWLFGPSLQCVLHFKCKALWTMRPIVCSVIYLLYNAPLYFLVEKLIYLVLYDWMFDKGNFGQHPPLLYL